MSKSTAIAVIGVTIVSIATEGIPFTAELMVIVLGMFIIIKGISHNN